MWAVDVRLDTFSALQLTYTTTRVGVYEFAKNKILKDTGGREHVDLWAWSSFDSRLHYYRDATVLPESDIE